MTIVTPIMWGRLTPAFFERLARRHPSSVDEIVRVADCVGVRVESLLRPKKISLRIVMWIGALGAFVMASTLIGSKLGLSLY